MWQKLPKIVIFDKNKDFLLKWFFLKKGQKKLIFMYIIIYTYNFTNVKSQQKCTLSYYWNEYL